MKKFQALQYKQLQLKKLLLQMEARDTFSTFIQYYDRTYQLMWFHKLIADKCQAVFEGKIKRLMVFIPPQFGKSQITSRLFPSWYLGNKPDTKMVIASYSGDLAASFCRDTQRIIEDENTIELFGKHIGIPGLIKNSEYFDTDAGGYYKSVGVGGSLTGRRADIAIIDDPVKDAMEAYSETSRSRVWEWYTSVLETRLHNDSSTILIMTRWHQDDLAGRLLALEPEKWEVISIPAVCEKKKSAFDPRDPGESLWEERHGIEKLRRMESLSARTFAALYQQNPTIEGGNIIKRDWFRMVSLDSFMAIKGNVEIHFFIDTAYDEKKKKTDNDPSGIIATCKLQNSVYIIHGQKVYKEFPDLIRFIPEYCKTHGASSKSTVRIEPKANGKSVVHQLKEVSSLNVTETPSPTDSKLTRLYSKSPAVECGRVVLVEGEWNEAFIDEVCGFPSQLHDEFVDLLVYALDYHLEHEVAIPDNLSKSMFGFG